MRTQWLALGAIAVAGVAGDQASQLEPTVNPKVQVAGLDANDTHASASLLGQFRTSVATWLYLHADLYLHNGVEMRPMTQFERREGTQGQSAGDNDLGKGEGSTETTVIPSAERDFRGWIGDLERSGGAYKDMKGHRHNPPETAMPLFKLMTVLDPSFIPGWTMGAMIIARDVKTGPQNAVTFLKRGVKENPHDFRIRFEIGYYLAAYLKSLDEAVAWLDSARQMASTRRNLSADELSSLEENYRWLGLCLKSQGKRREESIIAQEGIVRFPDDPVLARLAKDD
jgi:hypothetical protein